MEGGRDEGRKSGRQEEEGPFRVRSPKKYRIFNLTISDFLLNLVVYLLIEMPKCEANRTNGVRVMTYQMLRFAAKRGIATTL